MGRGDSRAVRFAYTLIQPWSLGLVCKCDAIFRPVSRVYNTFGLENPLRGPGPCKCVPRACLRACIRGTVVCDGQADTYTCVRTLQLQDPPNRLPIGSTIPTPASGTLTPTPNGELDAPSGIGKEARPRPVAVAMAKKIHSIPSLLSKFTAISFQDNLRVDGRAREPKEVAKAG
ncbi:hypothetical protein G5I_14747 [Acromyrmex echinatior]|uniref:Uncharacterized protein n=1 Tax=Acromyrmex echinatior TaxID=103372 RepID=F4X8K8_ACREC|nr:hypothetical protein G5I_14747 [Acromyrmex echinatior]